MDREDHNHEGQGELKMSLTLQPPPLEKTAPVTTVTVAATAAYTAPTLQEWRTVRHDPTPPASGQAGADGQADVQAGGHPESAPDPATAPPLQVWYTPAQEPVPAPLTAATRVAPCGPHSPSITDPYTAPTIQIWRTAGHDPTPPADGQAVPCSQGAQVDALAGSVDESAGRPLQLDVASRQRWAPAIQHVAVTYRLEPALLHAVISAESGYNPRARSPQGARGLMQLMPGTAARFAVINPYDPLANLHGGAHYLRWLLDLFKDLRLALAAYNAGESAVQRYGNTVPPYPETRTYVRRVLDFYHFYRSKAGL
jgi:hypothetical protein